MKEKIVLFFLCDMDLVGPREEYKKNDRVYDLLSDDLSKEIYERRIEISRTGSENALFDLISILPEMKALRENNRNEESYIFGCGEHGVALKRCLDKKWVAFIDNNISGQEQYGLPVLGGDSIESIKPNSAIYVTPKYYYEEIVQQLHSYGVTDDRIINVGLISMEMMERQYFDLEELNLDKVDVFCDVGAYDGFNTRIFFEKSSNTHSKSVIIEPGGKNNSKINDLLSDKYNDRYEIHQKGVSDRIGEVSAGDYNVWGDEDRYSFTTLDELLANENGNIFIKMDIEGAESEALKGARGTIQNKHPLLAISVYHRPQDIFEIPDQILSYYPGYRFFLRHYTLCQWDTVLYAIP